MFRSRSELAASLIFLVAALLPIAPLGATLREGGTVSAHLFLEVILNGRLTGLVADFTEKEGGGLAVAPAELAELGIAAGAEPQGGDGTLDLDRFEGLTYRLDRVQQVVSIDTNRLLTRRIDARGVSPASPLEFHSSTGTLINYTLFATAGDGGTGISTDLEGRVFAPAGVLTQTGILGYRTGSGVAALRLETTASHYSPDTARVLRAGDITTGGLSWTRPVRLGGIQVARDFAMRPDLVTMPIPAFSGTAAVPSTVDIYANGAKIYSSAVPAGPFSIVNVPIVSGAGTARLVITDSLGRTTENSYPFFASAVLLRKGLLDFSVEAGFPRLAFGTRSFDYVGSPAASGSFRYGLKDSLTIEGHAEGMSSVVNGGLGFTMPVANRGLLSVAGAASYGAAGAGALVNGDLSIFLGCFALRVATRRTFGNYADIASVSALSSSPGLPLATALDQASLTIPGGSEQSSLTLNFMRVVSASDVRTLLGLSFGRRIGDANLTAYAFTSVGGNGGSGIAVALSRAIGADISATAVGGVGQGGVAALDIVKAEKAAPGGSGWRFNSGLGSGLPWLAAASYRAPAARFSAGVRGTMNGNVAVSGEMSGAVVAMGNGIFASNRIDDAFAVVDARAPGVTVYAENRPAGKTGPNGKLLLPGLRSWETNIISIDPEDLPVDSTPTSTRVAISPGDRSGVSINFGVAKDHGGMIVLRDRSGQFLPPGSEGQVEGGGEFVVGYDGEAYLREIKPVNKIRVALDGGAGCEAEFALAAKSGPSLPIGEVVCR